MKDYAYILESMLQTLEEEIYKSRKDKEAAHNEIFEEMAKYLVSQNSIHVDSSKSAEERETILYGKIEGLTFACDLVRNYIKNEL